MKKDQSRNTTRRGIRNDRYTRLAMSSLRHCDRSIAQLRAVSVLVSTVLHRPAITLEERRNEHTVLSLLTETVEGYEHAAQAYRKLVAAVVTDARNLPDTQLSADEALRLMEAAESPPNRARHEAASETGSLADAIRAQVEPLGGIDLGPYLPQRGCDLDDSNKRQSHAA